MVFGGNMRNALLGILAVVSIYSTLLYVAAASGKETTPLDEALERPVKVEKFVDEENGVVCYFVGNKPRYLTCVKLEKK